MRVCNDYEANFSNLLHLLHKLETHLTRCKLDDNWAKFKLLNNIFILKFLIFAS